MVIQELKFIEYIKHLKKSLAQRIKFGSSLLGEENLQEDLSRVCEFRSLVKNRLVLIAQAYTHTKI